MTEGAVKQRTGVQVRGGRQIWLLLCFLNEIRFTEQYREELEFKSKPV